MSMCLWNSILIADVAFDPVKIASGDGKDDTVTISGKSVADFLQLKQLYSLIKRDALLISVIVVLILLITMLFIKKTEKLADRKADIMHKLTIVFIIASLVAILNILYAVICSIFH